MTEKELRLLALIGFGTGVTLAALYSQHQKIQALKTDLLAEKAGTKYYREALLRAFKSMTPEQRASQLDATNVDIKFFSLIKQFLK